jgi:hypothetical protein
MSLGDVQVQVQIPRDIVQYWGMVPGIRIGHRHRRAFLRRNNCFAGACA